jgi:hypothetical protein
VWILAHCKPPLRDEYFEFGYSLQLELQAESSPLAQLDFVSIDAVLEALWLLKVERGEYAW